MSARFGASILILAPHPDDEVVGCCAAIVRARAAGARVHVLFLTHGCLARGTLWPWQRANYDARLARRRLEAEAVARLLEVSIIGGSNRAARDLWPRLTDAEAEVRQAIAATGADQIWAPAYEGGNPDHDGANALAARLASEGFDVLEFAEYNFAGGRARSQDFPKPTGAEMTIALSADEQTLKRQALDLYRSERGNLFYVRCEAERLRPLAAYDYGRPPHEGLLWYERFRWIPFRHPRVDFTPVETISDALEHFVAAPPRDP